MNQSKKIVFKVSEFPHLSETFIIAQIVTAIKLGYDVQIIIRKLLDNDTAINSVLIKKYNLLDKIIIEDYNIPKNKLGSLIKWILLLISNLKDFNSIIKFHKQQSKFSLTWLYQWNFYNRFRDVSIFHVQYGTNSKPLDVLKKIGFKPAVIVTFHGHDAFFPINGYIQNNGYYDNLFKYADLITANTPYLADKIIELGCSKELLSIIPVGVDTTFFYPSKEKKRLHSDLKLITVGRLNKMKGQNFCIETVNKLIENGINVTLTIIGEGEERKELENLIKKYQLANYVFLKGSKSQEEIRAELWLHDVYLLTGQAITSGLRETQGLATLEAQACGLPAIVFDSGGVKYTLEDGVSGFVCDEFDIEAIVRSVIKFIDNPVLLSEMSIQAVKYVKENYSQKIIDQKWKIRYNNLSDGK